MELSVVVSTLNGRDRLPACLEALRADAPAAEVVVVNGPSSDGTAGMVVERDDVDVLVEIADRSESVARNAGYLATTGDVVAFLGDDCVVDEGWFEAIERAIGAGGCVVTGPTGARENGRDDRSGSRVAGRAVTHFEADNVAFSRPVLEKLDGFDEYLPLGGARDAAHRLSGMDVGVVWRGDVRVRRRVGTDGGEHHAWGPTYRAYGYRLGKNYGPRPTILARGLARGGADALAGLSRVTDGEETLTGWLADGRHVVGNALGGFRDGLRARRLDPPPRRNPSGASSRWDRAVRIEDWR